MVESYIVTGPRGFAPYGRAPGSKVYAVGDEISRTTLMDSGDKFPLEKLVRAGILTPADAVRKNPRLHGRAGSIAAPVRPYSHHSFATGERGHEDYSVTPIPEHQSPTGGPVIETSGVTSEDIDTPEPDGVDPYGPELTGVDTDPRATFRPGTSSGPAEAASPEDADVDQKLEWAEKRESEIEEAGTPDHDEDADKERARIRDEHADDEHPEHGDSSTPENAKSPEDEPVKVKLEREERREATKRTEGTDATPENAASPEDAPAEVKVEREAHRHDDASTAPQPHNTQAKMAASADLPPRRGSRKGK